MKIDKRLQFALDLVLLAALFWIVRYWHSRQFGLYEDDLTIIPDAFVRSLSSLMGFLGNYIIRFSGHARPLSNSGIYLFSWIGWHLAGLWGPYLIGYLITVVNIGLFYGLLRRVAVRPFALLAGLFYILYSADTTQAYLTHSLGLQTSITLVLLAMHAYLSNRRVLAYILGFLVLFDYETPFLLFLAAPLLGKTWNKRLIKEFLIHVGILAVMVGAIYGFRMTIGEGRVEGLTPRVILLTPPEHMIEGPLVSLGTFAYRPLQALRGMDFEVGLVILLTFGLFLGILSRLNRPQNFTLRELSRAIRDRDARAALPEEVKSLARLFLIGLVLLVMAYPLTFTIRAYAISGRDTRVHAAGVVGAAVLLASAMLLILGGTHGWWHRLVLGLLALELALLAGYGFVVQRDYVNAWQYQRQFWTELVPLIPDAGPGTVVLVDPAALHDTLQIGANYWNLPRVLDQLFIFPYNVRDIPVVHRLAANWQDSLVGGNGEFMINAVTTGSPSGYYGSIDPRDVVLIQAQGGKLVRRTSIVLHGKTYTLKPISAQVLPTLPHGFLYLLMVIQP